jgi:tRNA dimethylallyltransferase
MRLPVIVAVVGPTAVGKTSIAMRLAEDLGGEIVSLDSRQMYRRLDVGTAKPTPDELRRAAHHLVDIAEPDEALSLARVQDLAYEAVDGILARERLPILAGGSGQYVAAVLEGWQIPRVRPDTELRARLAAEAERDGADALHRRLADVDPVSAERIDARNLRRVVRALEVYEHTGHPISELQARQQPPYDALVLGLTRPRQDLFERIDRRVDAMVAGGLESEVRGLVADGYGFDLPAMSGVGYGEWRAYFAGEIDRAEVVRLIRRNTRRLARSQSAWFRLDDPGICWFDLASDSYDLVLTAVKSFLR